MLSCGRFFQSRPRWSTTSTLSFLGGPRQAADLCLEKLIRVPWFKLAVGLVLAALLGAADLSETRLGQGINAYNIHDYGGAIQHLQGLAPQLPKLSDYIAYNLASSEMQVGDIDGAVRDLTAYRAHPIASSPLAGKLSLMEGRALS